MTEIPSPEDIAQVAISPRQARDFANRVLGSVAERLAGDEDWYRVGIERHLDKGDSKRHLAFRAECDDSEDAMTYTLEFADIYPLNDEWDPQAIKKLFNLAHFVIDEEGLVSVAAPSDEPEIEELWPKDGYLGVEHGYSFWVPYRKRECLSAKAMNLIIIDEDGDPVDTELGFSLAPYIDEVPAEDIRNFIKYGETFADIPAYERELSEVTVYDLSLVTDSLINMNLLRADCKPLSKRVL